MFCTKCGSPLNQDSKFCTNCGAPVEEVPSVTEVNIEAAETEDSVEKFQLTDDEKNDEISTPTADVEISGDGTSAIATTKKNGKKWIIIGAVAAAVVILAVILIVVLSKGSLGSSSLAYRKGEELMLFNLGAEPFMVSDDFGSNCYARLEEDSSSMYYVDSYEYNSAGYSSYRLYYRDTGNEESKLDEADSEKGVLISRDVYTFNDVGDTVVYLRDMSDEGGKLRVYHRGEEISLDNGVRSFRLSEDGKKVVYLKSEDDESDLYEVYISEPDNTIKIASDVYSILNYRDDTKYESYLYLKENDDVYSVYVVNGGESSKLLSDIVDWTWINDQLFLLEGEETEIGLEDVVIDDMPEDDFDAQYIREAAENYPYTYYAYNLYMIENDEAVLVVEDIEDATGGNGYVVYLTRQAAGNSKPNLSDLIEDGYYYWDDIYYDFYDNGGQTELYAMKIGGEEYQVFDEEDVEDYSYISYDVNSGYLYWIDGYDADDGGELMRALIGESGLGETEKIDRDVNYYFWGLDGEIYYVTDEINGEGTAYCFDGEESTKIADDVYNIVTLSDPLDDEAKILLFWTDYDEDAELATLNVFNGKELVKVDDDVYCYNVMFKGEKMGLFYLKDYDYNREEGELCRWDMKNDTEKIDDDVSEIVA